MIGLAVGGSVAVIVALAVPTVWVHAEAPYQQEAAAEAPAATKPQRYIRLHEVKQHGRDSERKWVTRGTSVFDITDWIPAHPGGSVILQAVGGSIDRFWDILTVHKKQDVYDILQEYCIGEIDPGDLVEGRVPADSYDDPFVTDPTRDPRLLQHTSKPCNAETPTSCLGSYITPNETFYVRNHLWVPAVDDGSHVLTVELPDGTEKLYSLADLKSKFQPFTVTATLQCSGNRRKNMSMRARSALGLQWDVGAISNAEWTGARLKDVLQDAGFPVDDWTFQDAKHVHFVGAEAYGASIPMAKALDPLGDVMLAYEMAGSPLPPDHGYPLRVLVPGHTAARSVKWLERIILDVEESQSQWQQHDYKCFGPNQSAKEVDWSSAPAIQETPVQSAITSVTELSKNTESGREQLKRHGLEEDAIKVQGYAFSGGGREVVRVDVSADGGKTWQQAIILPDEAQGRRRWSWKRWELVLSKRMAGTEFVAKAVDDSYNSQPESYEAQYNFRGNLTTAWHRVEYHGQGKE
jgi:sulfite oxidase